MISLSVNQVIKSCLAAPTLVLAVVLEKKSFSWPVVATVALLTVFATLTVPFGAEGVDEQAREGPASNARRVAPLVRSARPLLTAPRPSLPTSTRIRRTGSFSPSSRS